MRSNKPRPSNTINVTALDRKNRTSKSTTVYDCTPEEVIAVIEAEARRRDAAAEAAESSDAVPPSGRRREPAATRRRGRHGPGVGNGRSEVSSGSAQG